MAQDDFEIEVRDADSVLGLDEDDLAIIAEAENDADKVVTKSPPRPYQLGYTAVFCIIVNKMIGTGIFDNPSTIMYGTRSVGVTLILWSLGGVAAVAGTLCFIEYGLTIPRWDLNGEKIFTPRSGGEFNYLNYLIKRPKFLATCVFGVAFILVGNAAANALSFARHVLAVAGYSDNAHFVRGIAIGTVTAVCLLHGLWRKLGITINNVFAFVKISILVMIIILGFVSIGGKVFGIESPAGTNLDPHKSFSGAQTDAYGYASAYLAVVFTFGGFNQANYVLGEIREPRRIFKSATLLAVGIVWIFFIMVPRSILIAVLTMLSVQMLVVPAHDQVTGGNVAEQFIRLTLGRVSSYGDQHATQILNAFMAISSLGNVIVSTYTAARVKQEIAKEGILPFSRFFARNYDGMTRFFSRDFRDKASKDVFLDKTPLGSLMLHWFFSLLIIACTWGATSPTDAYKIIFGVFSYVVDAFFGVCICLGLLGLRLKKGSNWHLKSPSNAAVSISAATIFVIANTFPLIVLWIQPTAGFLNSYQWYLVPTISVCLLGGGLLYWVGFMYVVPHVGKCAGKDLIVERMPFFHTEHGYPTQWAEIVSFFWVVKQ